MSVSKNTLLSSLYVRTGRSFDLKLGDKEVDYNPNFKLYIQTKLEKPHYKPEVAAQTPLINFMITLDGIEEQLLAIVVNKERPDLEAQKTALLERQNNFKIQLKGLEDNILMRLSSSQGDILADVELIEALETTKKTAKEIEEQVKLAKITEVEISTAPEVYRPVGIRGSLLYFLVDSLWILDHMYRFSMANFVKIFIKGMFQADEPDKEEKRSNRRKADDDEDGDPKMGGGGSEIAVKIDRLIKFSCFCVCDYVSQCLFHSAHAVQMFIRTQTGKTITINVASDYNDTIHAVKAMIWDETGIPPAALRLRYVGKMLQGGSTLADYNIQQQNTLDSWVPEVGGGFNHKQPKIGMFFSSIPKGGLAGQQVVGAAAPVLGDPAADTSVDEIPTFSRGGPAQAAQRDRSRSSSPDVDAAPIDAWQVLKKLCPARQVVPSKFQDLFKSQVACRISAAEVISASDDAWRSAGRIGCVILDDAPDQVKAFLHSSP